ncbi:MAG TPA: hypothetical protein PKX23_11690 [Verrucomicrobiota bacterium]|nr:hypothetical protein [Verrucomicrobiota bacterium]HRT07867.1 hypothetical protein [Candidatus Paceibacterota bacterium]HRT56795.1 hypothetical protein [Candidatus Paceibacterota bacterium]
MDADERDIFCYLKAWPKLFVSASEIARRAGGKRRYRENPEWALPVLSRMVEKAMLETDSTGHYRINARYDEEKKKRWVSPQIQQILARSGKTFEGVYEIEDTEGVLGKAEADEEGEAGDRENPSPP